MAARNSIDEAQGEHLLSYLRTTSAHHRGGDATPHHKISSQVHPWNLPCHDQLLVEQDQIWGGGPTQIMGDPAAPHEVSIASSNGNPREEKLILRSPYIVKASPIHDSKKFSCKDPVEEVVHRVNKWSEKAENLACKAENLASNLWRNLKTGQSVREAAWGKVRVGAKALTMGGFNPLFKHNFSLASGEKLRKKYACYLSTSTGPVAGTLYVSTVKIAFCSDRPLSFTLPSGHKGWSYYRVAIPLEKVQVIDPAVNEDFPAQKYIQVVTVDDHEFWFMGFVHYHKALKNLQLSVDKWFHSSTTTTSLPHH